MTSSICENESALLAWTTLPVQLAVTFTRPASQSLECLLPPTQAEEDAVHHLAAPGGITPDEFIIPVRVLLDKALRVSGHPALPHAATQSSVNI